MEYKVTGADDEYITNHDHSSQRYVFVFIDNSGDNIRSSGTSVIIESNAQAYTAHSRTDDTGHKVLSAAKQQRFPVSRHIRCLYVVIYQHLEYPQQEGQHENSVSSLYAESRT